MHSGYKIIIKEKITLGCTWSYQFIKSVLLCVLVNTCKFKSLETHRNIWSLKCKAA